MSSRERIPLLTLWLALAGHVVVCRGPYSKRTRAGPAGSTARIGKTASVHLGVSLGWPPIGRAEMIDSAHSPARERGGWEGSRERRGISEFRVSDGQPITAWAFQSSCSAQTSGWMAGSSLRQSLQEGDAGRS